MVAATQDRRRPVTFIQRWFEILALILRIVLWPVREAANFLLPAGEFDGLSPAVTEKAAQHFVTHLKTLSTSSSQSASINEAFSTLGFAALKQEATTSNSLIIVYLFSPLHRQADEMCKKLIQPTMLEFLKQTNITALGASVHTSQGASLSYQLKASCYPLLAVLQPVRNSEGVKLMFKAEGPAFLKIQSTQLLSLLTATYQRHNLVVLEQETRRLQREQENELRRQQDEEYQESLRADRLRERERQEEREREERRIRDEEAREREKARAEEERLENAKALMRPEPASGGTRIRFVLPNGKKLDRRFENDETVGALKAYLVLYFAEEQPEIKNIALSTNFPKTTHNDDSRTLKESDLCPQSVLMVQDLDA